MPSVYIYPVLVSEQPQPPEGYYLYDCPVYMNKARQTSVLSLPLPSREKPHTWIMAGTAIVLDPGMLKQSSSVLTMCYSIKITFK